MGMEIVELIMRVEEEFSIEIPDSEAERLTTPGALCDCIESKLTSRRTQRSPSSCCPTSLAFYAVRRQLMQLGIERQHVTPSTPLAELWPASERRQNWHAVEKGLNYQLPSLRRSPEWAFVALLPLSVFPIWLWASPTTALTFFALTLLLWCYGSQATEVFAVHPPNFVYSVADLSRSLAPRFRAPTDASPRDIWTIVRALIADEFSIPIEQITRDADWFRDLGLS